MPRGHLVGCGACCYPGATNRKRHMYVLFVGAPLLFRYAMLSVVEAVVRGEKDIGIAHNVGIIERLDDTLHEIVYRLQ